VGGNAGGAATAAVKGAMEAAGELGTATTRSVSVFLVGVVEGVKNIVGAVVPKTAKASEANKPASAQKERASGHGAEPKKAETAAGPHKKAVELRPEKPTEKKGQTKKSTAHKPYATDLSPLEKKSEHEE
jgi:hypothetical protein